jgi:signal transduction histidine kinase
MPTRPIKPPSTERLIFWSVAFLLLTQMAWWIGVQVRESRRLQEARIAQMRAGRALAWQFDSMAFLRTNIPRDPGEGPGAVVGRRDDNRTFEERKNAIEERFPYVAVLPTPQELDDPVLLADQPAYLTLRPEVLEAMDRERTLALWRTAGEALVLVAGVLFGMTYIYRKLNSEMELMFRQRNFIASVTHELKTPIASLRVWMETIFNRELGAEQKVRIQTLMDGDLHRLTDLVANLLETARADAGKLELHLEPLELAPLVQKVCQDMDHRLGEGLLGLRLDLAPGISARVDPKAFAMVLENLLSNALKYASEPRETSVTLDGDTEDAILVVADRGHGIPPKELSRLFQRFYRVGDEMTRAVPGTGLGLFLCREIVRAHGGEIRVASLGSGLGTTFTIRLSRLPR